MIVYWERRVPPMPSMYLFKSYHAKDGVVKIFEEKDHSHKPALGKPGEEESRDQDLRSEFTLLSPLKKPKSKQARNPPRLTGPKKSKKAYQTK